MPCSHVKVRGVPDSKLIYRLNNGVVTFDGEPVPMSKVEGWQVISPGYLAEIFKKCEIKLEANKND